jgi:site-specific DNA-methyltransferase (adenine-specific)
VTDWAVLEGDVVWWLRELPAESVDAVVSDPPYGIGFMGHEVSSPLQNGPGFSG